MDILCIATQDECMTGFAMIFPKIREKQICNECGR